MAFRECQYVPLYSLFYIIINQLLLGGFFNKVIAIVFVEVELTIDSHVELVLR